MVVPTFSTSNPNLIEPMTIWKGMTAPEPRIVSLELDSTENTEPTSDGIQIPRELIGEWATSTNDPFPDFQGLVDYAKSDPEVWRKLQSNITGNQWLGILTG